jgi:predicted RNase H-like HicB family nuclease
MGLNMEKIDLKKRTAIVYDYGYFLEFAIKLGEQFGKVYYFKPWKDEFQSNNMKVVGEGMENIERIYDFYDYLKPDVFSKEEDVIVFPGVNDGDLQEFLIDLGYSVWGSCRGEDIETKRFAARQFFKELGLATNKIREIVGVKKLREFLEKNDNKFIKTDIRLDFETFHHKNYHLSSSWLDDITKHLGGSQFDYKFVVEDAIDGEGVVETGWDGFTIDGQFPTKSMMGYEIKDAGYAMTIKDYSDISPIITGVNKKLANYFKEVKYRGFFSSEIRVGKDKIPYLIDPACRLGSPPNELYQEMIANLGEIVYHGSRGVLVEPEFKAKFGVECMMASDYVAEKNWLPIEFPAKLRKWIKLKNATRIDGKYWIIPQPMEFPEIGAIVAIGDSLEEAIEKLKEYAEEIKGVRLSVSTEALDSTVEEIQKGEALGIKFF